MRTLILALMIGGMATADCYAQLFPVWRARRMAAKMEIAQMRGSSYGCGAAASSSCGSAAYNSCGAAYNSCGNSYNSCGTSYNGCGTSYDNCGYQNSCGAAVSCGSGFSCSNNQPEAVDNMASESGEKPIDVSMYFVKLSKGRESRADQYDIRQTAVARRNFIQAAKLRSDRQAEAARSTEATASTRSKRVDRHLG